MRAPRQHPSGADDRCRATGKGVSRGDASRRRHRPPHPPAAARGGEHLHPARGGGRVQQSGAALLDRQGFGGAAASRAQGLCAGKAAVPPAAHRHDVEIPRNDRVPRRPSARARPRPHRPHQCGRSQARYQPDHSRLRPLYRRDEDAGAAPGARRLRLQCGFRRRAPRRGGVAFQGTRVLAAQRAAPLGPEAPAAGAVAAVQRPRPARRKRARVPAVELDRTRRVALHPPGEHPGGAALFRGAAAGGRARRPPHHDRRRAPAAEARRAAADQDGAVSHARMLSAHRRDRERGGERPRHHPRADREPLLRAARPPHRPRRSGLDGAQEAGGLLLMTVRPDPGAFALDSFLDQQEQKSLLRFVVCGSVDHGKSTLIGRLLYEAKLLFQDQLEALMGTAAAVSGAGAGGTAHQEIDFSLLLDGLVAEREQKITIDVAYRLFTTDRRKFIVADAPGHEQYTRNMATGASTADLALILVNAADGLTSQTRRHSLIVSTLGVRHLVVAVNKMDLVGWSQERFDRIEADFRAFAADLDVAGITFIPVAARSGDNVVNRSPHMGWYRGPTLLAHLEQADIAPHDEQPFRMPIQWVNRPNAEFRGYSGLITAGEVFSGMAVQIWPSGRLVRVERIVTAGGDADLAEAGAAPLVSDRLSARVVWMSEQPLTPDRRYLVKAATATAQATAGAEMQVIDLDSRRALPSARIANNEIGACVLTLDRLISVDRYRANRATGGFIILDPESYDTIGLGIVEAADTAQPRARIPAAPGPDGVKRLLTRTHESRLRSAAKALTWRIVASLVAFAILLALTGSVGIAGSVALADIVGRTILYYLHERMWARIAWGNQGTSPPAARSC